MSFKVISAEEAALHIHDDDNVGFGGFTAAGTPKVVPQAIARRAEEEHAAGRPFRIGVFTGASTSDRLDGALSRAKAIKFRTPYQSCPDSRAAINAGEITYCDVHLSELAQMLRYGFLGKIDVAVIEATSVTDDGKIVLGPGVGIAPTVCQLARKIIIEVNAHNPKELAGFHDIYQPADPPHRREIPIYRPSDRIGVPYIQVDPAKIVGIVETNFPDGVKEFAPSDEVTMNIGRNVSDFLTSQLKAGLIPSEFLPIQSGVGNIANAVLGFLGSNPDIPPFQMYTEVIQDSVIGLLREGRCTFNHPELVRRMGLITINTALEADIFGNVNSTHVTGTKMMNGIGGSADFTRNGYISIFTCPSVAKGGKISAIVPMVSHLDHSEHSVNVIVTEYGVADLRGKDPRQRAELIIENCAHPMYRPLLREYLSLGGKGHTPHFLRAAYAFHEEFLRSGDMAQTSFAAYK